MSNTQIKSPEDAVKVLGKYISGFDREVLCVINMRSDGIAINCNFISMGSVNESIAHPREIFKSAILSNAASMVLMHNHPSGNLSPSKEDTITTDRMLKLSEILGIPLKDHIIVGANDESYFSFREKKMLNFDHNRFERDYQKLDFPPELVAEDNCVKEESAEEQITVRRRRGR